MSQGLLLLHNSVLYFEHTGIHIYNTLIYHWLHHLAHCTPYLLTSNLPVSSLTLPNFSLPLFTLSVRSNISLSVCDLLHLPCPQGYCKWQDCTVPFLHSFITALKCGKFWNVRRLFPGIKWSLRRTVGMFAKGWQQEPVRTVGFSFCIFFFLRFDYSSQHTYLGEMLSCCLKFLDYIYEHNME